MLLAENPDILGEMGVEGLEMPVDGFLYIYVNNESAHDVQFDNLRIRYNPGQLLQVNHYYPYGLPIKELSTQPTKGKPYNEYLMTTKEWNTEFGLNEYDFGARSYDPAIARWYVQDPAEQFYNPYLAIGNNPVVLYDPDGRAIPFLLAVALIGGVINTGMNVYNGTIQGSVGDVIGQTIVSFGAGAAAGVMSLEGPGGWAAGGALINMTNTAMTGASTRDVISAAFTGAGYGLAGGAIASIVAPLAPVISKSPVINSALKGLFSGSVTGGLLRVLNKDLQLVQLQVLQRVQLMVIIMLKPIKLILGMVSRTLKDKIWS
jgi:RHS repeat-associated protein